MLFAAAPFRSLSGEVEADTGVSTPVFPVTTSTRRGEPVILLFGVRLGDGWLGSN